MLASGLGVCAAEGLKNDPLKFDLSESRRLDFLDVAKGSATLEIATFCGNGLLPRRLLDRRQSEKRSRILLNAHLCKG